MALKFNRFDIYFNFDSRRRIKNICLKFNVFNQRLLNFIPRKFSRTLFTFYFLKKKFPQPQRNQKLYQFRANLDPLVDGRKEKEELERHFLRAQSLEDTKNAKVDMALS